MFCDPTKDKSCYRLCPSCFKCADKGSKAECAGCVGKPDPQRIKYPDIDDYCDCRNATLRHRTREGKLIIAKIPGNPYASRIQRETQTADERDYDNYVKMMRDRTGDPHWDPIRFENGIGASEWVDRYRAG